MFAVFASAFLICTYLYFCWREKSRLWEIYAKIPGPKGNFLWGHGYDFFNSPENVFKNFRKYAAEYFAIYKQWAWGVKIIHINNPSDINSFIRNGRYKREYSFYENIIGKNVLTLEGSTYHYRKGLLSPVFSSNNLRNYLQRFIEQSERISKNINIDKEQSIDSFKYSVLCIKDTLLGEISNFNEDEFIEKLRYIFKIQSESTLKFLLYNKFISNLTKDGRTFKSNVKYIQRIVDNVVRDANIETKTESATEILTRAKLEGACIDNSGISDEVLSFFIAGSDAIANAIDFTLLCLANHEKIQAKVYQEITSIFGNNNEKQISYDDLKKLKYLDQCINESLRLFPPISIFYRKTLYNVNIAGYEIPESTYIAIHVYDIHHNPKFYPDPEKYDPDRFSEENAKERDEGVFIPFGVGRRTCLGRKFSLIAIKTVICELLWKYSVKPVDDFDSIELRQGLMVLTCNGCFKFRFFPR